MSRSETPLSDLIDRAESSADGYADFIKEFRRSSVGVIAEGAPEGTTGEFRSSAQHPIGVGSTTDHEGRPCLLAFADPAAFVQRFGLQFNADMLGESLLQTVLLNPDCSGILVNSAKKAVSIIIDRDTIQGLMKKPWWKLW